MRYYYYGDEAGSVRGNPIHAMHVVEQPDVLSDDPKDRDLIIEEDTIYEIDRECLQCRKHKKKK